eukprot:UN04942
MLYVELYRIVISKYQILYILYLLFIFHKYIKFAAPDVISHYNIVYGVTILLAI